MASPLPFAGPAHLNPSALDSDDLSQPLHRIDQAHQLIADLDSPADEHREPILAFVPGSAAAKESPTIETAAEVSPPKANPLLSTGTPRFRDIGDLSQPIEHDYAEPTWSPEQMLHAHAEDLITFLQNWSDDLDQRSAKLNADIATQERRERSFRLWMQQRRAEIEAEQTLQQTEQSSRQAAARRAFFQATEGEWAL